MKNSLIIFFFFVSLSFSYSNSTEKPIDPKKEKKILEIIFNQLKNKHLIDKKIDDNFSKKVFKTYLDNIDKYKLFFLESDIKEFKQFENKLDDQIKSNDLTFFYLTYDRIKIRMTEAKEIYTKIIKNKIDLFESGYVLNDKKITFQKNKFDLIKQWKLFVKAEIATNIAKTFIDENEKKQISKKEFNDSFLETANFYKDNFLQRVEITTLNIDNLSRMMFFENYINAFVTQFDIHSKYYIPRNRDEYLIKETGKNEGIGVMTATKDNFTQINSLVVGAPAWKSKKLEVGDIILKVAQENEQAIDVVGLTIYEVAKLTRGKSGTNVKLTIKKPNGSIELVNIKRGIVSSNDSYIKSCLVEKNKVKYAIISFPRFYNDFDDDLVRNAANDFEEELQILKESDVQGIIIDIRNNGGGSVDAATKIISNFIDKSTVLQVKSKDNKIYKFDSENEIKKWDKSTVLLVNSETASAAEIFATAFQEFNLGIILGRETFGKGTIQEFLDLNTFNPKKEADDDFGSLKICTQRFFKLNGKSVQKNGIIPDVIFPIDELENREKNYINSLIADQVIGVDFKKINNDDYFSKIIKNSQSRIDNNEYFNSLKKLKENEIIYNTESYEFDKFQNGLFKYIDKRNTTVKPKTSNQYEFKSTPADIKLFKRNEYLVAKRKNWYNELKTDLQIEESLNVLEDLYLKK